MARLDMLRQILFQYAGQFRTLQRERQALVQAQTRIPAIDAEIQDLRQDATAVLDRYNTLGGTNYTLADIQQQQQGAL